VPEREEHALDSLLADADGLLAELEGARTPEVVPSALTAGRDLREADLRLLDELQGPSADGHVEIVVAEDGMRALVHLDPPTGGRSPIEVDAVLQQLAEWGVTTGIDGKAIRDAVLKCNTERVPVHDVVAARGVKPVDEVGASIAIVEEIREQRRAVPEDGPVDFRELSAFVTVKPGTILARVTPKREGVMGSTVRGAAVAFGRATVPSPKPGRNTRWEGGTVVAACHGVVRIAEDSFWVEEVLEVPGNVDFSVGNIDFPGDVIIRGEILDGFRIRAGRSLYCHKSIDASEITTGGDLVTAQGIIGRRQAVIRSGGGITARFIENCVVEAEGPIRVQTSVMNSSLHTLGSLELGDRGILVGSIVEAQDGVFAAQIGSTRSPRSEIRCGIDYTVDRRLARLRDQNIALAGRLRQVEEKQKRDPGSAPSLAPLADRIRATIHRLNDAAREIIPNLDRNEDARVSVRGTVFPGTLIEICRVSFVVSRSMTFVTFRLDRKDGRIVAERYEQRAPGRRRVGPRPG
jgi:uncharacterized protein (DUF342 family)